MRHNASVDFCNIDFQLLAECLVAFLCLSLAYAILRLIPGRPVAWLAQHLYGCSTQSCLSCMPLQQSFRNVKRFERPRCIRHTSRYSPKEPKSILLRHLEKHVFFNRIPPVHLPHFAFIKDSRYLSPDPSSPISFSSPPLHPPFLFLPPGAPARAPRVPGGVPPLARCLWRRLVPTRPLPLQVARASCMVEVWTARQGAG